MAEEQSNEAGSKHKLSQEIHPIAIANDKSDEEFIRDYLKPSPGWTTWTHPLTQKPYALEFLSSHELSKDDFKACFDLIELTSGADYKNSSVGWHPAMKKKEMKSPDLRYILVKDEEQGAVRGFTSLMPTFENNEPVLYCYEVHLTPELQGSGLGKHLMAQLITIAEHIPSTRKVMLTCFTSNTNGLRFYDKLGFAKDDFSPRDRTLRGGKVVKPDYVILSRGTAHGGVDGG
ncbi:acyl-CoA N-acyltransferase [Trichoderma citrinoviride]|uniref:N-alpha-acetyltransferase 40 n=1 Tax=Trichoderma citrinoviride TaxID=58853 RepID=A0A2T4BHX4_9HYPO|nr:acyl-CoA N-acyltransferase [Trichoderma citrinoviride]PTB68861.1 acyl-CoA N-acyltransferase [Trichoderma citrinoviride]